MALDTLLITPKEVRSFSIVKGALDDDYIKPAILFAQDLDLSYVLGFNLTDKLRDLKEAGTLNSTSPYSDLFNTYVKPYLRQAAVHYALDGIEVDVNNQGLLEKTSQQGTSISQTQANTLKANVMRRATSYKKLLIDHLCRYSSRYPEYFTDQRGRQQRSDGGQFYGIDNW